MSANIRHTVKTGDAKNAYERSLELKDVANALLITPSLATTSAHAVTSSPRHHQTTRFVCGIFRIIHHAAARMCRLHLLLVSSS